MIGLVSIINNLKPKNMKKLFFVLALVGVITSCKSKKNDEKKPEEVTTTTPTSTATDATTPSADVPTFSDPEVQIFVNDYTAFIKSYKEGMMDPAKAQALSKSAAEWGTKMQSIAMKLSANPDDMQKWTVWAEMITKEMMPVTK